jgi:hypothetical protein
MITSPRSGEHRLVERDQPSRQTSTQRSEPARLRYRRRVGYRRVPCHDDAAAFRQAAAPLSDKVASGAVTEEMLLILLAGDSATVYLPAAGCLEAVAVGGPFVLRSGNQVVRPAARSTEKAP